MSVNQNLENRLENNSINSDEIVEDVQLNDHNDESSSNNNKSDIIIDKNTAPTTFMLCSICGSSQPKTDNDRRFIPIQ